METTITQTTRRAPVRNLYAAVEDVISDVIWAHISKDTFGRSSSWIYNKLTGRDGNGGTGGFTAEEAARLRGALHALSDRIRAAADRI
ncbi:MAG: DUF5053 domain-containing protein [Bacteroidaceae bacterium]|nr:DUF5053 domain-containing protein [Bacteroidaceae bacterium]